MKEQHDEDVSPQCMCSDGIAPYLTAAPCSCFQTVRERCQREKKGWFSGQVLAVVGFTTRPHKTTCVRIGQGSVRDSGGRAGVMVLTQLEGGFAWWEVVRAEETRVRAQG